METNNLTENTVAEEVVEPKIIQIDDFDRVLASQKLLKEMESEHTPTEDVVHNYLSDRIDVDDELVDGILKDDRTIKGAMKYCIEKARKQAEKGAQGAMVADDEVFGWVREYFVLDKVEPPKTYGSVSHGSLAKGTKSAEKLRKDREAKAKKAKEEAQRKKEQELLAPGQMDIFEMLEAEEEL